MRKILHITVHLGGGAGKAITGLAMVGDTIVLLESPQKIYWVERAVQKGIQVIIAPETEELVRLIQEFDVTVINWWGHPLMIQFMASFPEIPCRLLLYSHINGCAYPYLPFSFLDIFDAVMFTTPYSYENPFWTDVERKEICKRSDVVYGMGDFDPRAYLPRKSYQKKDDFCVGYIGTLNYAKLHPEFVKYCEAAAAKVKNIRFMLAGDMEDDVRLDIQRSRIAERFVYVGYTNETEAFYKEIDVLGYPLNRNNFATTENVLLEAMAYATPVVALNHGVERHIIEDGKNGYLADHAEAYAERIYQLYLSENKRKELGETARQICIEKYAKDKNKKAYEQILRKYLDQPKRIHGISVLSEKTPYEWFLYFSFADRHSLDKAVDARFVQQSKGSVFQYARCFPQDVNLQRACDGKSEGKLTCRPYIKGGKKMNTKIGKRWTNDRTRLQDVVPLDTPFLLFVDPSSICNFRCKFCPCGGANKEVWSKEKKPGLMSYELFRKVIDDLAEFPDKLKTLRLYKEGEPLCNKRLPDMIRYARTKNAAHKIDFTTNGFLFDTDTALAVMDAGVDRVNISVEALDADGYAQISGVRLDFQQFIDKLRYLYAHKNGCHIFIKISDLGLGKHTQEEFYSTFEDICDEMAVEHVSNVWPQFEVKEELKQTLDKDIYGGEMDVRKEVQVCPYLFYSMCVNSDGSVSACLMDWNHQLIVGDVRKQTLFEIWNSTQMRQLRKSHLLLRRGDYQICKNCGQLKYAVLDNMDAYREDILAKLEGQ